MDKQALEYVLEKARKDDVNITQEQGRQSLGALGLSGQMALARIGERMLCVFRAMGELTTSRLWYSCPQGELHSPLSIYPQYQDSQSPGVDCICVCAHQRIRMLPASQQEQKSPGPNRPNGWPLARLGECMLGVTNGVIHSPQPARGTGCPQGVLHSPIADLFTMPKIVSAMVWVVCVHVNQSGCCRPPTSCRMLAC